MLKDSFSQFYYSVTVMGFRTTADSDLIFSYQDLVFLNMIFLGEDCTVSSCRTPWGSPRGGHEDVEQSGAQEHGGAPQ